MEFASFEKTALITGGAVGIGKGIAMVLASHGYNLAISHYREEEQALEVARIVEKDFGQTCAVFTCDLTDAAAPKQLVEEAARALGRLDVVVNNAGITKFGAITEFRLEEFQEVIDLNLRAPLLVMQAAAHHMMDRGIRGSMVNIASTRGERAYPGDAVYGGGKAALIRATQSAALDLAPHGIRVNCVAPGATASREDAAAIAHYEALGRKIPLGRVASTVDIGEAVAWLASERAANVTGVTLKVDGGLILPGMPEDVRPEAGYGWGIPPEGRE